MKRFLIAPLLALLPLAGCATEAIQVGHVAAWEERLLRTTLPPPFGIVRISITTGSAGETTALHIQTDAGEVKLPESFLAQLTDVSEPQITYKKDGISQPLAIDELSIHVEFGALIYSEKYQDSFRKIAGWKIDKSMAIHGFEVVEFQ